MLKAEDFLAADERKPLPEGLRGRLRAIAREGAPPLGCRDVERLYEATRQQAWDVDAEADPAVVAHLSGCGRCRALYGTLAAAFRAPRRRLPRALLRRLAKIAERPRLPLVVRDARVALAASALLTASLMLLIDDPAKLYHEAAQKVSAQATVLAAAGEERQQALLEMLTGEIEARYEREREKLAERGHFLRELWREARDLYQTDQWRRLLASPALEGESDGEP